MSHYLTRHCDEHGEYEADVDGDQECEECRAQGKLPYQIDKQRIAALESEVAALRAEVEGMREDAERWRRHVAMDTAWNDAARKESSNG